MLADTTLLFEVDDTVATLSGPSLAFIAQVEAQAAEAEAKAAERRQVRRLLRESARDYRSYETLLA